MQNSDFISMIDNYLITIPIIFIVNLFISELKYEFNYYVHILNCLILASYLIIDNYLFWFIKSNILEYNIESKYLLFNLPIFLTILSNSFILIFNIHNHEEEKTESTKLTNLTDLSELESIKIVNDIVPIKISKLNNKTNEYRLTREEINDIQLSFDNKLTRRELRIITRLFNNMIESKIKKII